MKHLQSKLIQSWHHFTGRDLPPREIAIRFQIPLPMAREKQPRFSELAFLKKEKDDPDGDVNYFKTLQKNLRQLNRCKMNLVKKFVYCESFIVAFYPLLLKQVRAHIPEGGIPDTLSRQEMLDVIIDILSQLIDTYKFIFRTIYIGSNFKFARMHTQFDKAGFRILELSKFQQRVMGLRYRGLSEGAWLTVNIVFHVMWALGKADRERVALESISANRITSVNVSVTDLFLMLQLTERMNLSRWPTEWQFILDRYDQNLRKLVQVAIDDGGNLTRNASLSYCYDNRPSRLVRVDEAGARGPSVMIFWQHLNRKIMGDYMQFFHEKGKNRRADMSQKFEFLSFIEGLALVQLQLESLKQDDPTLSSDALEGQACDLRIFVGFKDVYPFLHNLHYHADLDEVGTRLVDVLAQRSAVLAEDHVSTTASVWFLQYQDQHVLKLKTQETQYSTALKIGSLVAYGFGNDGIQRPLLGVVSRIYRPSSKLVFLDITGIGQDAEPVLVTPDLDSYDQFDQHGKQVMYAILSTDNQGEAHLLFPPHCQFIEKDQLVVKRVKGQQMISLEKLLAVTKSYFCYKFVSEKQNF